PGTPGGTMAPAPVPPASPARRRRTGKVGPLDLGSGDAGSPGTRSYRAGHRQGGAPAVARGRGPSTMPMSHKAYAFNWRAFERDELPGLLSGALETGDTAGLLAYVERNRQALKDPYQGEPLAESWKDLLENQDIHEYGDFALTRFYDLKADNGLGYCWN